MGDKQQFLTLQQAHGLIAQACSDGRLDDAQDLIRQVLARHPDDAQAFHFQGLIAHQQGQQDQAIAHAARAVALAPGEALFHANLGEIYRLAGRTDLAIVHGETAIALEPGYPQALSNVGIAYYEKKDYETALGFHRRAIAANPDFGKAHFNCANALHALRRFDEAVECDRRAVALLPDFSDGWSNLGTALHHAGRIDEAITALRHAIALDPGNANAHAGLGVLLLMHGDFAQGWAEYAWRLAPGAVRLAMPMQHPWRGENLAGRHLTIHAEQGLGDTMQFARYVPLVARHAGGVTLRAPLPLTRLLRQSFADIEGPGIEILGERGTVPDLECALMSLPHLLGTRLETIPASVPYLKADDAEAGQWRERFAALPGLKVGLVWGGNPEHVNNGRRSMPLGDLAPLFAVPGVSFVSLQIGPPTLEIERHPELKILDVAAELVPFAATAAAISALDLVITIDSACAHLAGAMAKPVWLLTSWLADWRWFLNRDDSPWYPTMRLFRQREGQDWQVVTESVAAELRKVAGGDRSGLMPFRAGAQ